ncbi:helicase SWR1 [Lactuca sativa]|uniref:Uncharacterized protein n=1 Tax=Lactuca sativa TaxID=4236 RepID=A0A9R1VMX7_LACSA|nr:helicase SWR1 [Lactuca sativa]KAJ0207672.1 hypothetical protein LSAT_V11C500268710 [Lactuca sativa]
MANFASNRSPSPLSARGFRNSETNTTTRRSFSGNPFTRPNAVVNPRSVNPPTPANTPATTDHTKRGSVLRKSTGSSMFQDGKENHKDIVRSPARSYEKGFMAPTISAASKFTPSPRKKVLGEKNEVVRTSIQFLDKDFVMKSEATPLDQHAMMEEDSNESVTLEQKEVVLETPPVRKVTFVSIDDATDVTEDFDLVKIRPFCCSPQTSPIIAPFDADHLPPYDPKKNFLSPRPQFLRYKPNPRIELLLNKVDGNDGYGEDDVIGLEDGFNLSDTSSDTEKEEAKQKEEEEEEAKLKEDDEEEEKEAKVEEEEEKLEDLRHGSSDNLSKIISEEKQSDSKLKTASKPRFFTRSKTILCISVMFLVACFSVSFTDSPPMDLPIYKDVSFSEIYDESLKLAASVKVSLDGFVESLEQWSNIFVSYLSGQLSHFSSTHSSIQFFNLTPSPIQEEWKIVADYADVENFEEIQEFEEEMEENFEMVEEEAYEEMEVDVQDEVLMEDPNEIQPNDVILEKSLNLEDGSSEIASLSVSKSEMAVNDYEIESSLADTSAESETLTTSLTRSVYPIYMTGFSMVIVVMAAIFYLIKKKSTGTSATARVTKLDADNDKELQEESSCSSESSIQKGYKKKPINNKRDSLASSSEFSMGSASYGSFTTFEKIPIKHRDEVILTPIRRSSRLVKN